MDIQLSTLSPCRRRCRPGLLLALVCGLLIPAGSPLTAQNNASGFLHGQVVTDGDKTYTGLLRWGTEEAFWDDLFNADKVSLPHSDETDDEPKGRTIEVFGRKLNLRWGGRHGSSRQFVTRFGSIERIENLGNKARLTMKGGVTIEVGGATNDLGSPIEVRDTALGTVEIPWRKITEVRFSAAPGSAKPEGFRMRGRVRTSAGDFAGYVQWDKQECLSYDKLDGEEDDIELSLDMGKIRTIERSGRNASRVTLVDGRSMVLDGTNDVDDDNRGILVEDDRYGRVEIPWTAFERVDFESAGGSGQGYSDFRGGSLRGTVVAGGERHSGRIVFDLDEAYAWEMLDGYLDDIAYSIPMGMVARIEPSGSQRARVTLHNGESLLLGGTQDVTDDNDGILVESGDQRIVIPWDDVELLELEK